MISNNYTKYRVKFFRFILAFLSLVFFFNIISVKSVSADTQDKIIFRFIEGVYNTATPTFTFATINPDGTGFTTLPISLDIGGIPQTPQISPDGTKILFSQLNGSCNPNEDRYDVFVMNMDGTGLTNLTANLFCSQWAISSWFPDGTKIAFRESPPGAYPNIYTMDLTSGNVQKIITNGDQESISPDGKKIVYTTWDNSVRHIILQNLDGSHRIDLTPNPIFNAYYERPVWSPNGRKIAIIDQVGGLYTVDPDGTNRTQIFFSPGQTNSAQSGFNWSPDSTHIIFTSTMIGVSTGVPTALFSLPASGGTPTSIYQVSSNESITDPWWHGTPDPTNLAPYVSSFADGAITEGSSYSADGFIMDPESSSWTATVDYGDGTGPQPLTLTATDFSLSHVYKDNGTYTVTVAVTDNQGLTGTKTAQVIVSNLGPQVSTIMAPSAPIQVNTAINASANFTDVGVLDTHTASWDWGDGNTTNGTVTEANGSGSVTGTHTYTAQGVYTVTLTVTDKDGWAGSSSYQYIVIYDTNTNSVSGSKEFSSPAGAVIADSSATGKASFGFTAKYDSSGNLIPAGNKWASFMFKSGNTNLSFNATSYQWLVVNGAKAVLKGSGTLNNTSGYSLLISAIDGSISGGTDYIRYQIKDSSGNVVYDTQPGAGNTDDPIIPVSKGKVTIK